MSASSYRERRRQRAPKPLSVPAIVAVIGFALVVLGLGPINNIDLAGLGLILFFWGIISFSVLLFMRRRARGSNGVEKVLPHRH